MHAAMQDAAPSFLCPISYQVMEDPVVATDGHSYERAQIERWFKEHDRSPITNQHMQSTTLIPNVSLRNAISECYQPGSSPLII